MKTNVRKFLGAYLWRQQLKAKVPTLSQEIRKAATAKGVATIIQSAWMGYGEGAVGGSDEEATLTIKNKIATFNSAMGYLGYRFKPNAVGATVYTLGGSPFVIEATTSGDKIVLKVMRREAQATI